jgi:hypothetical protein
MTIIFFVSEKPTQDKESQFLLPSIIFTYSEIFLPLWWNPRGNKLHDWHYVTYWLSPIAYTLHLGITVMSTPNVKVINDVVCLWKWLTFHTQLWGSIWCAPNRWTVLDILVSRCFSTWATMVDTSDFDDLGFHLMLKQSK